MSLEKCDYKFCLASMQHSKWRFCVCTCIFSDFSVNLIIIHNTAGQFESPRASLRCERAEILCLCQPLTWTALQSTPFRAAILERLAWAEIAAWWPDMLLHPRHPLKKRRGSVLAVAQEMHPMSLSTCKEAKISWHKSMCHDNFNNFPTAMFAAH